MWARSRTRFERAAAGPRKEEAVKQVIGTAMLVGGFPALLLGQVTVDCPEATCQIAPYFEGTGGFVGEAAAMDDPETTGVDESEVNFIVVCGNVTTQRSVTPDSGGIVRQALTAADGLACEAEGGGTIEIDGLKDGGWYWINDDTNSAVTALIRKDSLAHPQTMPTDPGGVVLKSVEGGAATFAKHEPSGRVGIIPHIVPRKPVPDCSGAAADRAADCVLGTSTGWSLAASPSSVTRPAGSAADVEVTVTLTGTKFITTGTVAATANLDDLHSSVAGVALSSPNGAAPGAEETGVLLWTVTVAADADRCASTNPDRLNAQTVPVNVPAVAEVIPGVPTDGLEASFTVNCPAESAASRGVELAPGNPFPVD